MNNQQPHIKFDKATAIPVRDALINSYGFDLTDENQIGYTHLKLRFTILGFRPTSQYDTLNATIKIAFATHINDEYTYIDKLDLYNVDRLNSYCRTATKQLNINTNDEVLKAMYSLRERLEKYRLDELKNIEGVVKHPIALKHEQTEAMDYLKTDNILDSIEGLLQQAGIVTEKEKALQLFFILLSRHFEKPLHVLMQGSPQLAKMLMEVVGSCVPNEQIHTHTSMSASSMYYTKNKSSWKNNVLHITSIDKHFKGASTIREFIENRILKHYTTESNYHTGQIYGSNKVVEGAICLMAYSNDEVMNQRFFEECFFIRVNETEKNKAEMLEHLKKESCGIIDTRKQQDAIRKLKNIQRFIKPMRVIVPFASELELPESMHQQLRSLPQLLTFIKSVTLLHQHLLPKKRDSYGVEYIEATTEHLQIALELFRSIVITQSDILSQNQRNCLERLKTHVKNKENSFKIPEAMKVVRMSSSSFYREFNALKELGYVMQSGGNKKNGIEYKILEWDDYSQLQDGADKWSNQLKVIKGLSFPEPKEVSQKFPKASGKLKRA
jgi:DNA primase